MRWILYPLTALLGLAVLGVALAGIIIALAYPNLPSLDILTDYRPKIPLRIYTADGQLIGEFGEERRAVVAIRDVPDVMKQAILSAEDERFYQHGGIDTLGVLRAALANLTTGGRRQGASTITMQVARNFFLSSERTMSRKLYEALLSFKIEHNLTKDEIFQLYINQIYLGQRAYGFAAAAQIYFGKSLQDLNAAEAAMLAGLPKAPSTFNPVVNPKRARLRQQYVLRRMHELNYLTDAQYDEALKAPVVVKRDTNEFGVHAEYVAEMARQITADRFPEEVYTRGFKVYTTILRSDQEAAYQSLRRNVMEYDRRHGYRGAEAYVDMKDVQGEQDEQLDDLLADYADSDNLKPALVLAADTKQVRAYLRGGDIITLSGDNLKFATRMLDDKAPPTKRLRRGAVIRVSREEGKDWQITQLPEAESAFVAINPQDGAIRTLVGGFDYNRNKYNHVTQAWRQPGSSFKPFIYSASLEKGYTPATMVNDEPLSFPASVTGGQAWEPKNYDGKYEGLMRMRTALAKSKNMVSIRILQSIGVHYAQDYITRFGFDADKHPPYLTMALGAGSVTPWQMVSAYAIFANGGYRVQPYIVKEIQDDRGQVVARSQSVQAGDENIRAIDARNAFLMDSMLRDVATIGTAARASATLKRRDLGGKTGTTNDHIDAWFCGYQHTIAGCTWIGFDQPRKLGGNETGGSAALPAWISYMQRALKDVPEQLMAPPEGLTAVDVAGPRGNTKEYFYTENVPTEIPPEPEGDGSKPVD